VDGWTGLQEDSGHHRRVTEHDQIPSQATRLSEHYPQGTTNPASYAGEQGNSPLQALRTARPTDSWAKGEGVLRLQMPRDLVQQAETRKGQKKRSCPSSPYAMEEQPNPIPHVMEINPQATDKDRQENCQYGAYDDPDNAHANCATARIGEDGIRFQMEM